MTVLANHDRYMTYVSTYCSYSTYVWETISCVEGTLQRLYWFSYLSANAQASSNEYPRDKSPAFVDDVNMQFVVVIF
jgi:hypothetical protein